MEIWRQEIMKHDQPPPLKLLFSISIQKYQNQRIAKIGRKPQVRRPSNQARDTCTIVVTKRGSILESTSAC